MKGLMKLSFAVSTTFIRFSVDEWHLLKVGCLRGGGVLVAQVKSLYVEYMKRSGVKIKPKKNEILGGLTLFNLKEWSIRTKPCRSVGPTG